MTFPAGVRAFGKSHRRSSDAASFGREEHDPAAGHHVRQEPRGLGQRGLRLRDVPVLAVGDELQVPPGLRPVGDRADLRLGPRLGLGVERGGVGRERELAAGADVDGHERHAGRRLLAAHLVGLADVVRGQLEHLVLGRQPDRLLRDGRGVGRPGQDRQDERPVGVVVQAERQLARGLGRVHRVHQLAAVGRPGPRELQLAGREHPGGPVDRPRREHRSAVGDEVQVVGQLGDQVRHRHELVADELRREGVAEAQVEDEEPPPGRGRPAGEGVEHAGRLDRHDGRPVGGRQPDRHEPVRPQRGRGLAGLGRLSLGQFRPLRLHRVLLGDLQVGGRRLGRHAQRDADRGLARIGRQHADRDAARRRAEQPGDARHRRPAAAPAGDDDGVDLRHLPQPRGRLGHGGVGQHDDGVDVAGVGDRLAERLPRLDVRQVGTSPTGRPARSDLERRPDGDAHDGDPLAAAVDDRVGLPRGRRAGRRREAGRHVGHLARAARQGGGDGRGVVGEVAVGEVHHVELGGRQQGRRGGRRLFRVRDGRGRERPAGGEQQPVGRPDGGEHARPAEPGGPPVGHVARGDDGRQRAAGVLGAGVLGAGGRARGHREHNGDEGRQRVAGGAVEHRRSGE
jgi:hypothetical protein